MNANRMKPLHLKMWSSYALLLCAMLLPPSFCDTGSESYDCNQPCLDEDTNFEIIAKLRTYLIGGLQHSLRMRTFVAGRGFPEDTPDTPLAPTLVIPKGKRISILLRNEIDEDFPPPPNPTSDWLIEVDPNNPKGGYYSFQEQGFNFTNIPAKVAGDFNVPYEDNLPHNYAVTSLHFHGLHMQPHLFFPQGTSDPNAELIAVKPGSCYCYRFNIPEDHPSGTFWYHIHHHGSASMQSWSGMAGFLFVEGTFDQELADQGVERSLPFAIWDPHLDEFEDNEYIVANFLKSQNANNDLTAYIVNGDYQPTFHMLPDETVWYRVLCATTNNICVFEILDANNITVPYWSIASDSNAYAEPVQREFLVMTGGQREDLLLQFRSSGTYTIWHRGVSTLQFFGVGPGNRVLATIEVTGEAVTPVVQIPEMKFTQPFLPIEEKEVIETRSWVFNTVGDTRTVPFPQFEINDRMFENSRIDATLIQDNRAEEWILLNPKKAVHPFHLHVYPFQVIELATAQEPNNRYTAGFVQTHPYRMWRDTVMIPPQGYARIYVRYYAQSDSNVPLHGKTVFHCHFLAHEDTGMITNIMFVNPNEPISPSSPPSPPPPPQPSPSSPPSENPPSTSSCPSSVSPASSSSSCANALCIPYLAMFALVLFSVLKIE